MREKLYRSTKQKVIGGVAGGLGEYLNLDPVLIRIVFVLLAIFNGAGIIVYLIMWVIIPVDKDVRPEVNFNKSEKDKPKTEGETFTIVDDIETEVGNNQNKNFEIKDQNEEPKTEKSTGRLIFGTVLILMGAAFFAERFVNWFGFDDFIPILLIIIGLVLLWNSIRK
ncbi:MAG: PspC domain-containing protein [bacterium]